MGNITLEVSGVPLKLRETMAKNGRTYWCLRRPDQKAQSPFGAKIGAFADELPRTITVDGHEIPLEHDMTPSSYTDKKTGVTKPRTPRKRASVSGHVIPVKVDGGTVHKAVHFSVSEITGGWNIKASVTHSESPEEREARLAKQYAGTLAAFQA